MTTLPFVHEPTGQVGLVRQEPGQNQQAVRYQRDGGKLGLIQYDSSCTIFQ